MDISIALLFLRIVFGVTLAAHGAQKLFGAFGGPGIEGFAGWLASMGMRSPRMAARMAGMSEFFGGLLFAAGLLTPVAALLMVTVMLTAIATVHWKNGLFVTDGGYEYNLGIVAVALGVVCAGPGTYSIDHALGIAGSDYSGWLWAVGVLAVGAVATGLNLAGRSAPPVAGEQRDDASAAA